VLEKSKISKLSILETAMETIKTASFESLIDAAEKQPDGGYLFRLEGSEYRIKDVLEISKIAEKHGYIVIY
jgi:predicted acetyltransferase